MIISSLARTLRFRTRPDQRGDWFDTFTDARRYRLAEDVAAAIRTPHGPPTHHERMVAWLDHRLAASGRWVGGGRDDGRGITADRPAEPTGMLRR